MILKLYRKELRAFVHKEIIGDISELEPMIKWFCKQERIKECKWVLEGEAEIRKVNGGKRSMCTLFG